MSARTEVMLMTEDSLTADAVKAALGKSDRLSLNGLCQSLPQLTARLSAVPVAAVVADVDPDPGKAMRDLEPLIARHGRTRFVLLSASPRGELLLEAMQIGARHFMRKESIASELPGVLSRLVADTHRDLGGSVITVLSASGGCGATTIAVNLANELSLKTDGPSLLVDLDCCFGAAALYLGVRGEYGIADVISHETGSDSGLVTSSAVRYDDHLQMLLSPCSVNFASPAELPFDRMGEALALCRRAYPFTVVDSPRVSVQAAEALAHASNMTLIVMQMTVKDVHIARSLRLALMDRGVPAERLMHVINRYQKRNQMISFDQCREALGSDRYERVGNDFRGAVRSLNYGQPLAQSAPSSSLRADIKQLAQRLALETAWPAAQ